MRVALRGRWLPLRLPLSLPIPSPPYPDRGQHPGQACVPKVSTQELMRDGPPKFQKKPARSKKQLDTLVKYKMK